ncbi:MAG: TIGR02117 family protein [Thiohalomonadales bacterium]
MKHSTILFTFLFVVACSPKPSVVEPISGENVELNLQFNDDIYVVNHGWHTGFVIPAWLIQSRIPELEHRFKNIPYIEFGWGDEGFYQANEITTGLTIRALFWPTESVIHAVAIPEKAYKYFSNSHVEKICLNSSEYSSLVRFIENSFLINENGNVIKLKEGIYGDSQFYKGIGDYYLMNTCNNWIAKGLKSAGMDINPTFKLTAGSIMDFLVKNSRILKNGSCPLVVNELQ